MILLINTITHTMTLIKWNYAEYHINSNDKVPKFEVGDQVKISKYKNNFAKEYALNWLEEVFFISKIKNTVKWAYAIS